MTTGAVPVMPRAVAAQRERQIGQRAQVAGADRADLVHGRDRAGVERGDQRVQHPGVDARAARGELVEPHRHHRAGPVGRFELARAAGVAAQESQPVACGVVGDRHDAVGADPGGAPVDRADGRDVARQLARGVGAGPPGRVEVHRRPSPSDGDDVRAAEVPAVDDHRVQRLDLLHEADS